MHLHKAISTHIFNNAIYNIHIYYPHLFSLYVGKQQINAVKVLCKLYWALHLCDTLAPGIDTLP